MSQRSRPGKSASAGLSNDERVRLLVRIDDLELRVKMLEARVRAVGQSTRRAEPEKKRGAVLRRARPRPRCPGCTLELPVGRRGESCVWWGYWLVACEVPWGWATVPGPLAITWLILKVSGVPMLEDLMRKRPGFEAYQKRTSIFFPLPPRT